MNTYVLPAAQANPDTRGDQVRNQQLKVHFQYAPYRLIAHFIAATAVLVVLRHVVSHQLLLTWYAVTVAVLAMCAPVVWQFHRAAYHQSHPFWERYVMLSGLLVGLMWGIGGVVLFPTGSFEHQMLLLLLLVGLGAGALSSSVYLPQFYSFFPLTMLPIAIVLLVQGTQIHITVGVFTLMFVAISLVSARAPGRTLVDMLELQLENAELVKQLRQQKAEAERANIAKSKFLAAASHDLRQPVHALMLFTSVLDEKATPELRDIAGHIKTSVGALEELFDSLLDISRLDADVLHPEITHFSMCTLADRLANDFHPAAAAKGLALRCSPCKVVVHTDATLLERILRNLVSNAIRYTNRGEIQINCTQTDAGVRIDIVDTGIGIPLAQQTTIFNEFHQLDNPERNRNKGLGLGLAIVDRIARLLDHPLSVDSTPGKGSRFSILLPAGDAEAVAGNRDTWVDGVLSDLFGLQVLVVEDEIAVREGMGKLLTQWGCGVMLAGSENEAVKVLQSTEEEPDLLIVDYRLRDGRTGLQAIERVRKLIGRDLPVLIITGDTAAEGLRDVEASGYQLIHKPVQPAMLRACLRNMRKAVRSMTT